MQGATVDLSVFDKAARWHLTNQINDGGFTYRPILAMDEARQRTA